MLVWVPVFAKDDEALAPISDDPRVSSYYDRDARASRWFYQNVIKGWPGVEDKPAFRREKAWDAYFVYGAGASWQELRSGCAAGGAGIILERQNLLRGLQEVSD